MGGCCVIVMTGVRASQQVEVLIRQSISINDIDITVQLLLTPKGQNLVPVLEFGYYSISLFSSTMLFCSVEFLAFLACNRQIYCCVCSVVSYKGRV